MLKVSAVAALFLLSCASSESTTYQRGTYRPPAPAPTRPGVGAPTYDPHVTPLPPQPQPKPKRYLPPEPDGKPGIWASGAPAAGGIPKLLGVPFPFAPDVPLDDMRTNISCAEIMTFALLRVPVADAYAKALTSKEQVACLSSRLHLMCAGELLQGNKRAKNEGQYDAVVFERIKRAAERALAYHKSACDGVTLPDLPEQFDRLMRAALDAEIARIQRGGQ